MFFEIITFAAGVFMLAWIFFAHITAAIHNDSYSRPGKINHMDRFNQYKKFLWIPLVFGLMNVVVPDQRTMYLVAASEVGEKVATSERVIGLVDPTLDILKNYIKLENDKIVNEIKKQAEKKDEKK